MAVAKESIGKPRNKKNFKTKIRKLGVARNNLSGLCYFALSAMSALQDESIGFHDRQVWRELDHKLSRPRYAHVAFLVPDNVLVDPCSEQVFTLDDEDLIDDLQLIDDTQ